MSVLPTFHGVIPPMVTPFTDAGEVDTAVLEQLVEHLIASGVHGLFPLGSTGEVAYLTDAQRRLVTSTVATATAGRVPVLVGCIDLTAARVVEQARQARDAGADAIVATTPIHALNDAEEIAVHFQTIRSAVDLPLVAYDVPVRAHSRPSLEVLVELGQEQVIVGVKDSSGDDIGFRRLIRANRLAGSPLALLTGHELLCDAMLLAGADGMVPGLGNVDAAGYVRLYNAARAGDWDQAVDEQQRLANLFEIVFAVVGRSPDARGVGAFKAAMVARGLMPSARMAAGVTALTAADEELIARVVHEWESAMAESSS
ncbi:MAG: dihydrodipicolinate synthase family protein [Propionibacteriaceae bacterium]